MTEQELITAIALAVPKDRANAETVAKSMLALAIGKVGRMNGVSFNRDLVTFTFTANDATYKLGTEILQKYPNVWNLQELWFTDEQGHTVQIVALDEFNRTARGGTSTGRPTIGTIHSSTATLEIYPIPDSAYTACAYVKRPIIKLEDIPAPYHDLVYAKAIELIAAAPMAEMASKLAAEGTKEVQADALIAWDGSIVPVDRAIRGTTIGETGGKRADSHNLTGL